MSPIRQHIRTALACGGIAFASAIMGCSDGDLPTAPAQSDPTTVLAKLELNYKAIVLSVHAPYDTVRLDAVARNLHGDVLPHDVPLTFRQLNVLDQSVSMSATGLVRARSATTLTRVEVSLMLDGVLRADTASIMVRSESPIIRIARMEFFPLAPDSAWRWAGTTTAVPLTNWVRLYNAQNQPIVANRPTPVFKWDDPDVYVPNGTQEAYTSILYAGRALGETWFRAKLYAYDTVFSDSVLFRRVEPTIKFVVIDRVVPVDRPPTIVFHPSRLEIKPGMTVVFLNRVGTGEVPETANQDFWGHRIIRATPSADYVTEWVDSTGITFDTPAAALAGDTYRNVGLRDFTGTFLTDGGTGNIPSFSWVRCRRTNATSATACNGNTTLIIDSGFRSRKFTTPGTYQFSSTAFPDARGTIVVTAAP